MTVAESSQRKTVTLSSIGHISSETSSHTPEDSAEHVEIVWKCAGEILSNLQAGADLTRTKNLRANERLVSRGVMTGSEGFQIEVKDSKLVESNLLKPYINGRDLLH